MTDYDPPADLVRLKTDWYAAQALSNQIAAEPNNGDEVLLHLQAPAHAPGPVEKWLTMQSTDQRTRHEEARAEVMRLTLALADHPWWKTLKFGTKLDAETVVNRLALKQFEAKHAVAVG
jgi:hypothetical protein